MKTKHTISLIFSIIFAVSVGAYFLTYFVIGLGAASLPQDIGKIKYVTKEGNDVFAAGGAVVFNRPVQICDVLVKDNVAHITVSEFSIIRSPAMGVITKAENGIIEIDHGNETYSTISGIKTIGVGVGELVYGGSPIGSMDCEVTFSVSVSELPLDMIWLVEDYAQNESTTPVER